VSLPRTSLLRRNDTHRLIPSKINAWAFAAKPEKLMSVNQKLLGEAVVLFASDCDR
jgi:hypothetical protein